MRLLCLAAMVLLLLACADSARDSLSDARQELADGRYEEAIAAADTGLGRGADEVTAWGLELVKLEALARAGRAEESLAQLQRLAGERPEQVPADQYAATADQLRASGNGAAAIQVLDLGLQRFPDDSDLVAQMDAAKRAPAPGSDELEMLRSLGYVDQ
jgi:tetratricopeptide (TPR) repeat protein